MLHYAEAIRSHGTADGYNSEASERLHIDYAKEGYRASNKKDYIKQMTVWLGRQEAVTRFQAYLVYAAKQDNTTSRDSQLELEMDSDEEIDDPTVPVSKTTIATYSVSVKPAYPHISLTTITTDFKATGFLAALKTYIQCAYPPPTLPLLPTSADCFDVYKRLNISQPPLPDVGRETYIDRIRATPAVKGPGRLKDVPAHFDMALVRAEDEMDNESTKGTYLEGEFHLTVKMFGVNSTVFTDTWLFHMLRASCWTSTAFFLPFRITCVDTISVSPNTMHALNGSTHSVRPTLTLNYFRSLAPIAIMLQSLKSSH